jgi:hypothetical protein
MDIEGYELDVLNKSIDTIREANVISIELHNSKKRVDDLLLPHGFTFHPITAFHCMSKMIKNSWSHPDQLFSAARYTLAKNPGLLYKLFTGYDMNKNESNIIIGSYVKGR